MHVQAVDVHVEPFSECWDEGPGGLLGHYSHEQGRAD